MGWLITTSVLVSSLFNFYLVDIRLIISRWYWLMIYMLVLSPLWSGKAKLQHRLTSNLESARGAFLVLTYTKYSSMMLLNKLAYPVSELLLAISLWHHLLYMMTLLLVTSKETFRCFLDMTEDYSGNHRYCYQAGKVRFSQCTTQIEWNLRKTNIHGQSVRSCCLLWKKQHIWVLFERNLRQLRETVSQKIWKSRRTLYSLMSSGVHGENGLCLPL